MKTGGYPTTNLKLSKILLLGAAIAVQEAKADKFELGYELSTNAEYSSNPYLKIGKDDFAYSSSIKPALSLLWQEADSSLKAEATLNLERSSNTNLITPRNDPGLSIRYLARGNRSELRAVTSYEEVSTRTSEFFDTGNVSADETRKDTHVNAEWNYILSEFSNFVLTGGLTKIDYTGPGFTNYHATNIGAYSKIRLTERLSTSVSMKAQTYAPDSSTEESSNFAGIALGIHYRITESFGSEFDIQSTYIEDPNQLNDEDIWNGAFRINYQGDRAKAETLLSRETLPSGLGRFITADSAKLSYLYKVSQNTGLGFSANWRETDSSEPYQASILELSAVRRLTPRWRTQLAWQRKRLDRLESAEASMISISLNYSPVDQSL